MYLTADTGEVIENLLAEVSIRNNRNTIDVTAFGDSHRKIIDVGGSYIETTIKFMDLKIVDEDKIVVDPELGKFLDNISKGGMRV
jgi:hypothetical protein